MEENENDTTEQVRAFVPNPTGKGGFATNPNNINYGGRPKNRSSFSYWMNVFKEMSVEEFKNWLKQNPDNERTIAAELAYIRVLNSRKDLAEFREVADRTEGKAKQQIEIDGGFFSENKMTISIVEATSNDTSDAE